MNNLYIDYDKCLDIGYNVKKDYEKINELKEELNKIKKNDELNNDLNEIIKLSKILDVTADFLVNVSKAYKNVEKAGVEKNG